MKFRLYIAALHAALFCILLAASPAGSGSMTLLGVGGAAGGGACSQATTFLARTSGLSGTQTTGYTNLICGLVTDGIWTSLDALYIFATNTTTTANFNLVSTSFPITVHGSPTFTANAGYTGDGTAAFLDTTFVPSTVGGNFTQNAASYGVCVLNNRTTASFNDNDIASDDGGGRVGAWWFSPLNIGTQVAFGVNQGGSATTGGSTSTSQGNWIAVRTGATAQTLYRNGTSFLPDTAASNGLSAVSVVILARNGDPTFSIDQIGSAFIGGSLTPTQVTNLTSRLSTYLTAVGNSGC